MRADYIAKRLVFAVLTIFIATTFDFVLFRSTPGSPLVDLSRLPTATAQTKQALARSFGLNKSEWNQYEAYLDQLVHGNLGLSYDNEQPVVDNLSTAMANTVPMVALGTAVALFAGIAGGVVSAWRRGTAVDHVGTGTAIGLSSLPTQWLGLLLIIGFAGILPTSGMTNDFLVNPSFWQHVGDVVDHMLLPALTLAVSLLGGYLIIVRSSVLEALREDYILTARAKGLTARAVLAHHALPNAMLPTTTMISLSLGYLVTGAILIETVFSWPGIGRAIYQGVLDRDYPTLQGGFLILTVSVVLCNLAADLIYLRLDPRVAQ